MANESNHTDVDFRELYKHSLRKGIKAQEIADLYNKWADGNVYDEQLRVDAYKGPTVLAREAAKGLTLEQRATARVLDVAAGTGLCAEHLKDLGFQQLDALDPSQGMLDKAKEKNLYERYICDFISDKTLDIDENTYDLLTCCGGFGEGHIPCNALYEMVRLVKPGGRIVIVSRESHRYATEEYKDRLEPLMNQFEHDGKWKKRAFEIFPNYLHDYDGLFWVFEIC